MVDSVLVVCVGNICRSPMGERMLKARLSGLAVSSAGLGALVGHEADADALKAAEELGVDLGGHSARQLTAEIGAAHGLILAMEPGHRAEISRRWPQLSGRTLLFDQWTGGKGIADPYRKPLEFHRQVRDQIFAAAAAWAGRLSR
ncbi:low molecular weight phosphotyrosine protein phosphatase [Rhodobacter sp. SGA-6-6]|uniref:arsenate reductase/protein-tyrosine-phosphatase family protein n=1 Tax=Rhodobacter sp. SGA-6-6 TaxID=2710882 RepID=UPI0013EA746A|nr:low molecular weight phosphotyrosine protein phosphatase [Rhodobacter sp. SGA-6-6]